MEITADHPASTLGRLVILDDDGRVMFDPLGLIAVRGRLGLDRGEFAAALGVSWRTVQGWQQGRRAIPATALIAMKGMLERAARAERFLVDPDSARVTPPDA